MRVRSSCTETAMGRLGEGAAEWVSQQPGGRRELLGQRQTAREEPSTNRQPLTFQPRLQDGAAASRIYCRPAIAAAGKTTAAPTCKAPHLSSPDRTGPKFCLPCFFPGHTTLCSLRGGSIPRWIEGRREFGKIRWHERLASSLRFPLHPARSSLSLS